MPETSLLQGVKSSPTLCVKGTGATDGPAVLGMPHLRFSCFTKTQIIEGRRDWKRAHRAITESVTRSHDRYGERVVKAAISSITCT